MTVVSSCLAVEMEGKSPDDYGEAKAVLHAVVG